MSGGHRPPLQFLAQPGAANETNHDFLPFSIACHGPSLLLAAVESSQIAQMLSDEILAECAKSKTQAVGHGGFDHANNRHL